MIKSKISLTGRKRIRKSFGSINEVAEMPNLIDVQKASYEQFLSLGNKDNNQGLYRVFDSVFPISDFTDTSELQFISYELGNSKYDVDSKFSIKGSVNNRVLHSLLDSSLVKKKPPKSMDINDFGEDVVDQILTENPNLNKYDLLRTLVEFTVESIHYNISNFIKLNMSNFDLVVSGGGTDHPLVKEGLIKLGYKLKSVCDFEIDSSIKEALLIAVLGASRIIELKSSMPSVTGATKDVILGEIYAG